MADPLRLHIMQASLKFDLRPAILRAALDEVYDRGADVIGHTELTDHRLVEDTATRHGYRLVHPWRGSGSRSTTGIAVRRRRGHKITATAYVNTTPAQPGLPRHGGHQPRGLAIVELETAGSTISVAEMHTITGYGKGNPTRDAEVLTQWRQSTRVAARLGRGTDLAVLMGDVNYDPDDPTPNTPSRILKAAGWTSALDEAGKPDLPTHGRRTIDQLYTLDADRRVDVERVRRWTAGRLDHAQVSAWLTIQPKRGDR